MSELWERETETHIFFWGGILSNWHIAPFKARLSKGSPDIEFNCVEQFMMAEKAMVFEDPDSLFSIMSEKNPRKQKALGREVSGFNDSTWALHARNLTYVGVLQKFKQNAVIRDDLLSTGTKTLVEASPYDQRWGVGMGPNDHGITNEAEWKGENWLGQVLMKVRDDLRNDKDSSFETIDWSFYEPNILRDFMQ